MLYCKNAYQHENSLPAKRRLPGQLVYMYIYNYNYTLITGKTYLSKYCYLQDI